MTLLGLCEVLSHCHGTHNTGGEPVVLGRNPLTSSTAILSEFIGYGLDVFRSICFLYQQTLVAPNNPSLSSSVVSSSPTILHYLRCRPSEHG